MKIIIMTDLEGVAGVANAKDYIYPQSRYYEHACELATLEVSAAVAGALQAGATEVLVVDGHGDGAMKRSLLHPRARLLTGRPWVSGTGAAALAWGCDGSFAAAMSVGQHAMSNTDGGHLAHTQSFAIETQEINGIETGELREWMLITGAFGVPVVMVAGDEACCDEARSLAPNVETAAVKFGCKRGSATGLTASENEVFNSVAIHLSPNEARERIREHAYRGVKRVPEIVPLRLDPPYTLKVGMRPAESGKKVAFASIKSVDILDLLFVQRGKAHDKARKDTGKERAKQKTATKRAPARKKVVRKAAKKKVARKATRKKVAKKATRKKPARKRAPARKAAKKAAPKKKGKKRRKRS